MNRSGLLKPIFCHSGSYYYKQIHKPGTFSLAGVTYPYFIHPYNATWYNERAVELPVVLGEIKKAGASWMEVGNVLSHYTKIKHLIVDKYEKAPEVLNEDASTFSSQKQFDLVVSISTLEHIGYDEPVKNKEKIFLTLSNLRKLLTPGGKLLATIPLGYNPFLDYLLYTKKLGETSSLLLERIEKGINWKETTSPGDSIYRYFPFPTANVVMFVWWEKE